MRTSFFLVVVLFCCATTVGQENDGASKREVLKKLRRGSIQFDDVDEAWAQLKAAVKENPEADWWGARSRLSRAFAHLQKFDLATKIVKEGFDYHLHQSLRSNSSVELSYLFGYSQLIAEYAPKSSTPDIEIEVLDKLIPLLKGHVDANDALDGTLRHLVASVSVRCRSLPRGAAKNMLDKEFDRVRQVYESNRDNRFATLAYLDSLKWKAFPSYELFKPDYKRIKQFLDFATKLKEHGEIHKIAWGLEYSDACIFVIERIFNERTDDAKLLADEAIATLKTAAENDALFKQTLERNIKTLIGLNRKIAKAKLVLQLVETSAVAFDAAGWVNGEPTGLDQLAGKVVLLDFTAVWCGPCIQQLPELKLLHKKYEKQGLEIISVTDQYDFVWDNANDSPTKSDESVELPKQLVMLKQFVSRHELPFRVMVTKRDSAMAKSYGVTSIPHAVVIDQQGIIRLIRTGKTSANANAVRRKIEELLIK